MKRIGKGLAVLFDMDGVLVDSYRQHYESYRELAAEAGIDFRPEHFRTLFGKTSRDIIVEVWGGGLAKIEVKAIDDRKEALYRDLLREEFNPLPGVVTCIDALDAAGFLLAVGSSGPPENVALVLDRLGRADRFAARVTGNDVTRGKPDPQVFLLAAKRLGLPPARCAVFEDAPAGVEAALAAGMTAIAITGTADAEDLSRAHRVIRAFREITPTQVAECIRAPK